jgi:hypothetical protein
MTGWQRNFLLLFGCALGLPGVANLFQHGYAFCCVRLALGPPKRLIQWNLVFGPSGALFLLHL